MAHMHAWYTTLVHNLMNGSGVMVYFGIGIGMGMGMGMEIIKASDFARSVLFRHLMIPCI